MLKDFQERYGKLDGAYWWAVNEYHKEVGSTLKLGDEPHRVHSFVEDRCVILRNLYGEELGKYKYEKQSKGTSKRKGKRTNPKPEQLEDTSS